MRLRKSWLRAVLMDVQFWVPVAILLIGLGILISVAKT